ncbi:uncharacterized protein N7477_005806 [Penicillium maclennaniae]|uniref:uncharacterized protein n=1 Tax=Penicillium maclennaniae TaxID=1343394 RepID=UPI0025407E22|nr:uncharacterized protein N7477_005806 [Penicillium maclennaniae]KAJ5670443.1 hypothetical protein N7477_005806 [Penicillium maclennaniae]
MSPTAVLNDAVSIVDIHQDDLKFSLVDDLFKKIDPPKGKRRSFPTLLLYDAKGLKLFEKITFLDEYYLTNAEIDVLNTHAKRIVERIPENAQLIELGSGNLRKVEILLRECERMEKKVDYYALDLSLVELQRTFAEISPEKFDYVGLHGLHGTYDDALDWLKRPENCTRPTVVLSMGSSMGNFSRPEAADFLGGFAKALKPSDFLLIGLDACKTPEKVFKAYNDSKGITRQFYENGLAHANAVLGFEAFKPAEWEILTGYDPVEGRHQAFYVPKVNVTINDVTIAKGEKLIFEEAWKYGRDDRDELCRRAGLIPQVEFGNSTDDYHIHMLSPATLEHPTQPSQYAAQPVPSLGDFQSLWTAWDIVTKAMVPRDDLHSKPIKLRNELIFYLGHIPTFFDIHMTRALQGRPTEPKYYQQIFERGIDPDVEDPEQCHAHSEIPDEWPPLDEILDYQERVRGRARSLLEDGSAMEDRTVGEALWIGFEHEAMHLETFLYMLLQSDRILPPIGADPPDFAHMSWMAKKNKKPNSWFHIPQQTLEIGLNDPNDKAMPMESFGWDIEKPQRTISVHAFEAQARPITNGEYAKYLQVNGIQGYPASWKLVCEDENYAITNGITRSSPNATEDFLKNFADWPLISSYDEVEKYAKWMGCRIPTFEEAKSIYAYSDKLRAQTSNGTPNGLKATEQRTSQISNGAGSSSSNGVNHAAPSLFRDLEGSNIGFKNWHPVPVTPNGDKLAGQGEMGGVWEWTSSPLVPHEGFEAMEIYPGYTSDFFDGKHNIILGGSWATFPRIAGRSSFVNWYQRNYLYAWAGARLVKDVSM